jgi:2'-5' RNA ligase
MVCLMVAPEPLNNIDSAPETATGARPLRIFVALLIAPDIALALAQYGRDLEQYSVRPVAPTDIHLTLVPPWSEVSLVDAVAKLRRVAESCAAFTLKFSHIGYGPEPRRPRFLWAECVASDEVAKFRAALLRAFGQADERPFRPHVTLARLRDKGRAIARKHPLDQILALTERIESIELMQSPPPGGGGYKVLASVPLGGNRELPSGA